jgi:hypothetical protein
MESRWILGLCGEGIQGARRDVVEAAASYIASQLAEGCTHDEAVAKMWRMLNEEWDETRAADVKRRRASFHIVS